ncbi:hypothetical protein H5410_034296 [Solanum commersonii]|uniref:Uncharacterized protein n=1 Tax=Solanum commersonii TaxID=4109 RepID=A0A9J5YVM6_SOLCO|nr:hypothetical protein H5410_049863 [Solanum commersonii]KAG5602883.1 hypothetical protein H5410_034253 [Solanum commersonii]KAG5602926.1 hypothetical protein H5410_034296 [Solanum commersonii]
MRNICQIPSRQQYPRLFHFHWDGYGYYLLPKEQVSLANWALHCHRKNSNIWPKKPQVVH